MPSTKPISSYPCIARLVIPNVLYISCSVLYSLIHYLLQPKTARYGQSKTFFKATNSHLSPYKKWYKPPFFFNTSHKLAQFCIHLYFEWMIFEIMQSVYIYIPDRLHNIAFFEHIESALQNVLIKIRFKGIKKAAHFQFFLKMNGLSRFCYLVE